MHASTEIPVNELYLSIMKRVRQTAQKERERTVQSILKFSYLQGGVVTDVQKRVQRWEGEKEGGGVEGWRTDPRQDGAIMTQKVHTRNGARNSIESFFLLFPLLQLDSLP